MKTILPYLCLFMTVAHLTCYGQPPQDTRWNITPDQGIAWQVKENDTHFDHIEMSGLYLSSIVHYGVDQGTIKQKVHLVFPMLRTIPNDTHASLSHDIDYHELDPIKINGVPAVETPKQFGIKGVLAIRSVANEGIEISHQLFPSTNQAVFIDQIQVHNPTNQEVSIDIPKIEWSHTTAADQGVYGAYTIQVRSDRHGKFTLKPNETLDYALIYSGKMASEALPYVASNYELNRRNKLVHETFSNLVLESPDEVINREFAFAKLRAVESIFYTKGGLMHAPGGDSYYAAIWANDQAEYANPFFPFQGNLEANESAINSFRHFARYMNPDYRPIPSSIIAEGTDFWNGAGDRGDMAMIAYGASRFALANGDLKSAQELWPLITWCLEYCRRQLNEEGVVRSDSDELEGRFPAGKANLNTSSLYYDALVSAVYLGKELKADPTILNQYRLQSERIKAAIETYFGTTVSGFETYQYYEGNDVLRAWICTPLTVDIFSRSHGTIDALFSEKLWTEDGLASASGSTTFWDRATLYALRGVFAAGETKRAMPFFKHYSKRRLLGEHVPYPVEAYPEGNQRHLSAESALYCRIITEGLFGIRPTGLNSFNLKPQLPDDWNTMALRNVKAFKQSFDIEVNRSKGQLAVKVFSGDKVLAEGLIKPNDALSVQLNH